MSLYLIATPIGNPQDIGHRALSLLRELKIVILEEFKESTAFLRQHGITSQTHRYEQLNEHTGAEDLQKLCDLCAQQDVALITDCGTPGFADPGADLIRLCRAHQIRVHSVPGASALMTLLSLSSQKLTTFFFRGFLPQETELRHQEWLKLKTHPEALVIMDTPYRLRKTLDELVLHVPDRNVLLALNLTQDSELVLEGLPKAIQARTTLQKAEFMVLIYPAAPKPERK